MEGSKKRNYGIDLLRLVAMFMVCVLHVLGQGGILSAVQGDAVSFRTAWLLEIAAYGAVDCFALISGYVGVGARWRPRNILVMWGGVVFWAISAELAYNVIHPGTYAVADVVKCLFPVLCGSPWYFRSYAAMFPLIPLMNRTVKSQGEHACKVTLFALLICFSVIPLLADGDLAGLSSGYSAFWLALLYLAGACLRQSDVLSGAKMAQPIWVYVGCVLIGWVLFMVGAAVGGGAENAPEILARFYRWVTPNYISPLTVLGAVALLAAFARLQLPGAHVRAIKYAAPAAFGVYIIHSQPCVWAHLGGSTAWVAALPVAAMPFAVVGLASGIFVVCFVMEKVRLWLFSRLGISAGLARVGDWLERKIQDYADCA